MNGLRVAARLTPSPPAVLGPSGFARAHVLFGACGWRWLRGWPGGCRLRRPLARPLAGAGHEAPGPAPGIEGPTVAGASPRPTWSPGGGRGASALGPRGPRAAPWLLWGRGRGRRRRRRGAWTCSGRAAWPRWPARR
eukprot:5698810-Pyramimonas_sp.AAC.1